MDMSLLELNVRKYLHVRYDDGDESHLIELVCETAGDLRKLDVAKTFIRSSVCYNSSSSSSSYRSCRNSGITAI